MRENSLSFWESVFVVSLRIGHDIAESIANADAAQSANERRIAVLEVERIQKIRAERRLKKWSRKGIFWPIYMRGFDSYGPRIGEVYDHLTGRYYLADDLPDGFGELPVAPNALRSR